MPPPELAPVDQVHQVEGLPVGLVVLALVPAPVCGAVVLGLGADVPQLGAGVPPPELAPVDQVHQVEGRQRKKFRNLRT